MTWLNGPGAKEVTLDDQASASTGLFHFGEDKIAPLLFAATDVTNEAEAFLIRFAPLCASQVILLEFDRVNNLENRVLSLVETNSHIVDCNRPTTDASPHAKLNLRLNFVSAVRRSAVLTAGARPDEESITLRLITVSSHNYFQAKERLAEHVVEKWGREFSPNNGLTHGTLRERNSCHLTWRTLEFQARANLPSAVPGILRELHGEQFSER